MAAVQATGRLMGDSQSRKEAGTTIADILKTTQKMRVECWNIQTLFQIDMMPQLVKEFDNYTLDILGVIDVRWTGTEKEDWNQDIPPSSQEDLMTST